MILLAKGAEHSAAGQASTADPRCNATEPFEQHAVLLHGFGADRQTWTGLTAALGKSATVWLAELPGHGQNDAVLPATNASISGTAAADTPAVDAHAVDAPAVGATATAAVELQNHVAARSLLELFAAQLDRAFVTSTAPLHAVASEKSRHINIDATANSSDSLPAQAVTDVPELQSADANNVSPPYKLHIVGHSLGGAIAAHWAAHTALPVASVTLLAPAGLGAGVDRDFLARYVTCEDAAVMHGLLQTLVTDQRLIPSMLADMVLAGLARAGARSTLSVLAELCVGCAPVVAQSIDTLVERGMPLATIWGNDDRINTPTVNDARRWSTIRWQWLETCGHLPHIEQRRAVLDCVRSQWRGERDTGPDAV